MEIKYQDMKRLIFSCHTNCENKFENAQLKLIYVLGVKIG